MFILGEGQRRPRKLRSRLEKFLKYYYTLLTVAQFACALVFLSYTMIALPKTMVNSPWVWSDFSLTSTLELALINCSQSYDRSYWGFKDITLDFSVTKLTPYLIARCAEDVRFIVIMSFLALFAGFINRLMFDLNRYSIIIKRLAIHKEIFMVIELSFHVALLVRAVQANDRADFLRSFFTDCGMSKGITSDAYTILIRTLPYILPATAIYASSGIVLGSYFLAFIVYMFRATESKPTLEYLETRMMEAPLPMHRQKLLNKHDHNMKHRRSPPPGLDEGGDFDLEQGLRRENDRHRYQDESGRNLRRRFENVHVRERERDEWLAGGRRSAAASAARRRTSGRNSDNNNNNSSRSAGAATRRQPRTPVYAFTHQNDNENNTNLMNENTSSSPVGYSSGGGLGAGGGAEGYAFEMRPRSDIPVIPPGVPVIPVPFTSSDPVVAAARARQRGRSGDGQQGLPVNRSVI